MNSDLQRSIRDTIRSGNVEKVRAMLQEHPDLINPANPSLTWMEVAAYSESVAAAGGLQMILMLIDLGCDINASGLTQLSPLSSIVSEGNINVARCLLENGADPNLNRAVISAVNDGKRNSLELLKLLEQYGADLHRCFPLGNTGKEINALSMAMLYKKQDVVEYLKSKGAQLPGEKGKPTAPKTYSDQVIDYFAKHFGEVQPLSLIEIVPISAKIAIHVIPATAQRNHTTLFTVGMSSRAMRVPSTESDDYRFAELFIQLPGNWPLDKKALADLQTGWPIHWLRRVSSYPDRENSWLGGPVAIWANGDPPEPIAPGSSFTSMLLLAERHVQVSEREKIQLYRLIPLYSEERNLEITFGISSLMRAFDNHETPFVFDPNRPNVGR